MWSSMSVSFGIWRADLFWSCWWGFGRRLILGFGGGEQGGKRKGDEPHLGEHVGLGFAVDRIDMRIRFCVVGMRCSMKQLGTGVHVR